LPLFWVLSSNSAWGQTLRFEARTHGGIAATGNSLGLSKATDVNGPGTRDSIGTFMSLSAASVDNVPANVGNAWPSGTTASWMLNGSEAVLDLPNGAKVLYAELVWGGSTNYGTEDVRAALDTPVTLSHGGPSIAVTPDAATAVTLEQNSIAGFFASYYLRSADVSAFVSAQGAGTYSVSGVPATQSEASNSLNAAGWSLIVAYWSVTHGVRDLQIRIGGGFVDEEASIDYGFDVCVPPSGTVNGRLIVSALEGDANLTGDQMLIGEAASLLELAGPNNSETNFFASQLNDADGLLDTRGSFGSVNHDAGAGTNTAGARQSWDLTSVALSSNADHVDNGQTGVVVRAQTVGDTFIPTAVALELDSNGPNFVANDHTSAGPLVVEQGETFMIATSLDNSGLVAADMTFFMPLESGVTLVSYTTDNVAGDAAGQPVTAATLATGVDAGALGMGEQRVIRITLQASGAPASGDSYHFEPLWEYSYTPCVGTTTDDTWPLPSIDITLAPPGSGGAGGETGAAGADPGAAGDNTGGAPDPAGGAPGLEPGAGGTPTEPSGGSTPNPSSGSNTGGTQPADSGGAPANTGGNDGTDRDANSTDDSGCSCRTPATPNRNDSTSLIALLVLASLARRRAKPR
jgi:hypothetical protein